MGRDRPPDIYSVPGAIEAIDLYAEGTACHAVPIAFIPILLSALDELTAEHIWQGTDQARALVLAQVRDFIALFGTEYTECSPQVLPGKDCTPEIRIVSPACEAWGEIGASEMSLCGYNPKAFKIEENTLFVRDFCGEWVAIGNVVMNSDDPVIELPPEIDNEQTPFFPCGMATALGDIVELVASEIWDRAVTDVPLLLVRNVQNAVGLDLNNYRVGKAAMQALIMRGSVVVGAGIIDLEKSDVVPSTLSEQIACEMLPFMSTSDALDGDRILDEVEAVITRMYPYLGGGNNVFIRNYYAEVLRAIGGGNMVSAAEGGKLIDAGNCLCPGDEGNPTEPGEGGWYLSEPYETSFTSDGNVSGWAMLRTVITQPIYGVVFNYTPSGDVARIHRANDCNNPSGSFDNCLVTSNTENLSVTGGIWYAQAGPDAIADLETSTGLDLTNVNYSGDWSDVVATPAATAGQLVKWVLIANGGSAPASVQCTVRFVLHT